jgi:hypothetical protein
MAIARALRVLPDAIAELAMRQTVEFDGFATDHRNAVKAILGSAEPDFRN